MEIRDVVDSDWAAVWGFMQPILAAGDTYCWPTNTTEDAARVWWMGKPGGRVFVAVEDGVVVGTAELHPNQPAAGSHVANAGFMVCPTAAGKVSGAPWPTTSSKSQQRMGIRQCSSTLSWRPTNTQ